MTPIDSDLVRRLRQSFVTQTTLAVAAARIEALAVERDQAFKVAYDAACRAADTPASDDHGTIDNILGALAALAAPEAPDVT